MFPTAHCSCSWRAGSRFGWALVKNPQMAALMEGWLTAQTLGVSSDAQVRFLGVVEHLVAGLKRLLQLRLFRAKSSLGGGPHSSKIVCLCFAACLIMEGDGGSWRVVGDHGW